MYSLNKISKAISLIALTLGCFGLSPQADAVCQEGCLTNQNTVLGEDALIRITGSTGNTATGFQALNGNTEGSFNTATGSLALQRNKTGNDNTGIGADALLGNISGNSNTAIGVNTISDNTTGSENTAVGAAVLLNSDTGEQNTGIGAFALLQNTIGGLNTAIGAFALKNNTTGTSNIAVGFQAGRAVKGGNNNIYIGNPGGGSGESSSIRIGTTGTQTNAYVAGISGVTVPSGVGVIIDTNGHLGTVVSSERFKDAIKPMDKTSEAILALEPVTFRYKKELDPKGIPQFGLIAEEVAKINPDLVARDDEGKPYTVRYEAVNAMLLNEFLKEHRKMEELEATVAAHEKDFKSQIAALAATVKAQEAQIQKVSDQLGARAPAPRVVAND